tara:strand:- start:6795 stop:8471 length:1677 start_codon:yes stop_codon:yes gene_type:complete
MDAFKGGRFYVPDKLREDWFKVLGRCFMDHEKVYMSESFVLEDEEYPFHPYFDLDFWSSKGDGWPPDLDEAIQCLQQVVKSFYPGLQEPNQFLLIVCMSQPKPKRRTLKNNVKVSGLKLGVHLHMPQLKVTLHQMLLMLASIKYQLQQKFPRDLEGEDPWSTILDPGVYGTKSQGLRLLYSRKATSCCKRRDCDLCGGRQQRTEQSAPYTPTYVLKDDGQRSSTLLNALQTNPAQALMSTSIRVPGPNPVATEGFVEPQGRPAYSPLKSQKQIRKRSATIPARVGGPALQREQLDAGDAQWHILERTIRSIPVYADCEVTKVMRGKGGMCYLVNVVSDPDLGGSTNLGQHYCSNKGGYHGGSSVYFLATTKGLVQKCFSHKAYNGIQCRKQFASVATTFPKEDLVTLFPTMSDKNEKLAPKKAPWKSSAGTFVDTEPKCQCGEFAKLCVVDKTGALAYVCPLFKCKFYMPEQQPGPMFRRISPKMLGEQYEALLHAKMERHKRYNKKHKAKQEALRKKEKRKREVIKTNKKAKRRRRREKLRQQKQARIAQIVSHCHL